MNQIKNSHIDLEQDFNRMTIETYNVLYNIRHKFEQNPKLNQALNMTLMYDFGTDRSQSILELAAMIGDITNILNFELKNTIIRDSQFTDLQRQLDDARNEYEDRLN